MATLFQLAGACGGTIEKVHREYEIEQVSSLENASPHCIAPYYDSRYQQQLNHSQAGAILAQENPQSYDGRVLKVANPQLAIAKIMAILYPEKAPQPGVADNATLAGDAKLGDDCYIAQNAVIETGVMVGHRVQIHAGAYIGAEVSIGADCVIGPNCVLYAGSQIGQRVKISAGSVIGADGFGYVPNESESRKYWLKIPHAGKVVIGDNVEIGANSTIDKGSITDTIIGADVIIDNLVQIAHNVKVGRGTAIAGCSAIAGSTVVGERCRIGGRVSIVGHLKLCDEVTIYSDSLVTKSISTPGVYSSSLPAQPLKRWQRTLYGLKQLGLRSKPESKPS